MTNIDGLEPGERRLTSSREGLIGHGGGLDAGLLDE